MSESEYPKATAEGFTLGMFVSYDDCGDAWVTAPDGSVCTLIWETGDSARFVDYIAPDPNGRWGTFQVVLPLPLTNDAEAERYLRALLPELKPRWEAWAAAR